MVSDIALFITAIGVLGVVVGLRQNYLERLQQFEGKYVERYWKILDGLTLAALSASCPDVIVEADEKGIRSYILLCEDELEMRKNGYISDMTYDLWAESIKGQFKQEMFWKIWQRVKEETGTNNGSSKLAGIVFPANHRVHGLCVVV